MLSAHLSPSFGWSVAELAGQAKGSAWPMTLLSLSAARYLLNTQLRCSDFQRFISSSSSAWSNSSHQRKKLVEPKDKWNYNASPFDGDLGNDLQLLRHVDANMLEKEPTPPHGVRMLVRDFIEDSLYNPNYGYFPKQATIFNAQDTTFDFSRFRDSPEFQEEVAAKYAAYGADKYDGPGRQLWHTPTELFKVCSFASRSLTLLLISVNSLGMGVQLVDALSQNTY